MYEYRFPKLPTKIFRSFGTLFLCQSSIFWRRDLYFECGGLNLKYQLTSDRDLILRITSKSRLEYMDKVLSRFRLHSQNLSKTKAYLADIENKSINEALNVGPTTILKKVYAAAGHLYVKLKNPAMINWKLKNLINLAVKR
jgi:hypothetical protein